MSIALLALGVAVLGAGAAVGQQAVAGKSASVGLLAEGAQGSGVSAVQRALGIPASGVFDQRTEAAVRSFQRRRGLLVDGIVGPQTSGALGLAASGSASAGASTSGSASGTATGQAPAANGSLAGIAQCESGGDPHAVGGGGQFRGKYQFTRETWQSVGGSGDPAAAPEAEQDRRAAMLYQRSGSSSWPVCGG
jgi:hypothetical protein